MELLRSYLPDRALQADAVQWLEYPVEGTNTTTDRYLAVCIPHAELHERSLDQLFTLPSSPASASATAELEQAEQKSIDTPLPTPVRFVVSTETSSRSQPEVKVQFLAREKPVQRNTAITHVTYIGGAIIGSSGLSMHFSHVLVRLFGEESNFDVFTIPAQSMFKLGIAVDGHVHMDTLIEIAENNHALKQYFMSGSAGGTLPSGMTAGRAKVNLWLVSQWTDWRMRHHLRGQLGSHVRYLTPRRKNVVVQSWSELMLLLANIDRQNFQYAMPVGLMTLQTVGGANFETFELAPRFKGDTHAPDHISFMPSDRNRALTETLQGLSHNSDYQKADDANSIDLKAFSWYGRFGTAEYAASEPDRTRLQASSVSGSHLVSFSCSAADDISVLVPNVLEAARIRIVFRANNNLFVDQLKALLRLRDADIWRTLNGKLGDMLRVQWHAQLLTKTSLEESSQLSSTVEENISLLFHELQ